MQSDIVAVHIALSLALFLTMNWMGRHLGYSGYITLSAFLQRDASPAFNFLYRALTPTAFIVILATALYAIGLSKFVVEIWHVVLYYYIARLVYVIAFDRAILINWGREAFLWALGTSLSFVVYERFITQEHLLLPEAKELAKEFWLFVILFLYSLANHLKFGDVATKRRKSNYVRLMYKKCSERYGDDISRISDDRLSESLIYAILLFEQFNRPALIRMAERLVFPWGSKSIGPMQVQAGDRISDPESVRRGASTVMVSYRAALLEGRQQSTAKNRPSPFDPLANRNHRSFVVYKIASSYNKDDNYLHGITEMHSQLVELVFSDLQFVPFPHWSEHLI